jgi:hypothetical protein
MVVAFVAVTVHCGHAIAIGYTAHRDLSNFVVRLYGRVAPLGKVPQLFYGGLTQT